MSYNNRDYWSSLVGNSMRLQEVGWPQWTEAFNAARYKLTSEQTIATLQTLFTTTPPKKILEIGCGIGFWTNVLTTIYPTVSYMGIDISQNAIAQLNKQYIGKHNIQFQQLDITIPFTETDFAQYDLVICMEVLLHIKDTKGWQVAIANCINSTNNYCIISDPFNYWAGPNAKTNDNHTIRSWHDYAAAIEQNNATLLSVSPRTFLLDNNIDFKSKWALRAWKIFFKFWHKLLCIPNETLGKYLGIIAYRFDRWYCTQSKFGHSCRQIVLQKK
jgi:2-polyprenyl-3-methyl-5-hydroxy-6-metoxy-1,4-benzoquinol methylase